MSKVDWGVVYIALPGVTDVGAKQFAKHSDEIGEFIVEKSDDIIDTFKKWAKVAAVNVPNQLNVRLKSFLLKQKKL